MSLSRQCNKYLCFDHLKDHTDRFNEELTPINNEFNQLFEQLNKISLEEISFIKELNKWCLEAHQHIHQFYQQKRKQFEIFLQNEKEKQENDLNKIQEQFKQISG